MLTTTNTMLLDGLAEPANEAVWREFHERYRPIIVVRLSAYVTTRKEVRSRAPTSR